MAAESDFITACETGDVEAVTRILENVVVSDDQLQKGLSSAAWTSHPAVADILLSKGAKVDRSSFLGSTNRRDPTMFEVFVKHGFDINSTEFEAGTPLRAFLVRPNAATDDTKMGGYERRWDRIKRTVGSIVSLLNPYTEAGKARWQEVIYHPLENTDPNLDDKANGRVLIKYDPDHEGKKKVILWVEKNKIYEHEWN